jgi:hypothetical protein
MPTPTYTLLANVTLASLSSSVTFSSIPATYRDLVIVYSGSATSGVEIRLRYNDDAGSNYSYTEIVGTGSAAQSSTSSTYTFANGGVVYTGLGSLRVQILDYSATDKHKTGITRSDNAANNVIAYAHRWANTSAINSILINSGSVSFNPGFTFSLYGIVA